MVQEKTLATGEKPTVVIDDANGDIRLMGWERPEVLAKVEGDLTLQQNDDQVVHLRCNGASVVRIPHGATLNVVQSQGDVRIKSVNGSLKIGNASGDLALRHVSDVTIDSFAGDASIKHVNGNLTVNNVNGDLSLLDVHTINITHVGGDMGARGVAGGATIANVGGDVVLEGVQGNVSVENTGGDLRIAGVQGNVSLGNTGGDLNATGVQGNVKARQVSGDINAQAVLSVNATAMGDASLSFIHPLASSDVKANGDIVARFTPGVNADVHITSEASNITVHAPDGSRTIEEHNYDFKIGAGEVNVQLSAMGDVSVMSQAPGTEAGSRRRPEFDFDFDFDFDAHHGGDFGFAGMGERIAQRAREAAERATAHISEKVQAKVERAARRAEEQARHAERRAQWTMRRPHFDSSWRAHMPPQPPAPPREPVSDEERMTILRMLEQKKINATQAEQLLAALSGKGA